MFSCLLPFLHPPAQSPSMMCPLPGQQQPSTASPCKREMMAQRPDTVFVCSCCYLSFQREVHAFRLLQITQKSLFTSSQLLCYLHSRPGLCWIWPTDFKQSFVCSCQVFFFNVLFSEVLGWATKSYLHFFISSALEAFKWINCNSGPYYAGELICA